LVAVVQDAQWLTVAMEEWPITLALALLFLALFLWMCTPFAVFGVKRRLDRIARALDELVALTREQRGPVKDPGPGDKK
jgi:hypothetical protein